MGSPVFKALSGNSNPNQQTMSFPQFVQQYMSNPKSLGLTGNMQQDTMSLMAKHGFSKTDLEKAQSMGKQMLQQMMGGKT